MEILKYDLAKRILNLDPDGEYRRKYGVLIENHLGVLPEKSGKPLTIMFSIGGAGAQKEIVAKYLADLAGKIKNGKAKAIVSVGTRREIGEYFIKKIKKLGYLVKLDSNGSRPDVLKKIFDQKLVEFVAMDIKNSLKKYSQTVGTEADIERVKLSVDLIRNSKIPYEFRTTVVPGLHTEKDFIEIGKWLEGTPKYYLQKYREMTILDQNLKKKTKGKKLDLQKIKKSIDQYFGEVGIRE